MSTSKRFFEAAIKELLDTIKDYDSDTFFAKGNNLTDDEAMELAGRAIHLFLDNRLDGVLLTQWLDQIRGE